MGYTDPLLKNNRRQYVQFIKRCKGIGLVDDSLACQWETGIFLLKKKNGRTRLILDCRAANLLFLEPPSVELLAREGLSNIEFETLSDETCPIDEVPAISLGVADVSD